MRLKKGGYLYGDQSIRYDSDDRERRRGRDREPRPRVGKQDRHFVTALSRGLDVLSCFRSGSRLLGNQDISERCRLPKSTVSRLTYTLTKLGYLHYVKESGKYRLGTATLALGSAVLGRFEVRDLARPLMQELADATGTSVALGARQRLSMVCVEVCKGNAVLSLNMEVGMRLPLATSAIGRAYLAVCGDTERADLLDQLKELDHVAWPALKQGIDKSLAMYQELGVCARSANGSRTSTASRSASARATGCRRWRSTAVRRHSRCPRATC